MKILVLGVLGMAGHVMAAIMQEAGHEVVGLARRSSPFCETIVVDACNPEQVKRILTIGRYDIVINCIGVLNKKVDEDIASGIYLNSVFPHLLEQYTANSKTRVIHISTDCVFSGNIGEYREDSFRDADSFYGRSKALGELNNEKDLTIRTSIIGPELLPGGIGLFHWFMNQNIAIEGYTKALWTGVTTIELAKAVLSVLEKKLCGLVHLVNGEVISKYHLLMLLNKMREFPIKINPEDRIKINKSLVCTRKDVVHKLPSYEEMVHEMENWIRVHSYMYPQYRLRGDAQ